MTTIGAVGTVDSTQVPTGVNGATSTSSGTLLDPNAFLKLLVAQLQYQDPSQPADMSSFMNQSATLSQVQSMQTMTSSLTSLLTTSQAQTATSMVGKTVTFVDTAGTSHTGLVSAASALSTSPVLTVGEWTVPLGSVTGVSADTGTGSTDVTTGSTTATTDSGADSSATDSAGSGSADGTSGV